MSGTNADKFVGKCCVNMQQKGLNCPKYIDFCAKTPLLRHSCSIWIHISSNAGRSFVQPARPSMSQTSAGPSVNGRCHRSQRVASVIRIGAQWSRSQGHPVWSGSYPPTTLVRSALASFRFWKRHHSRHHRRRPQCSRSV
jgi:hypothetical protein